MNYTFDLFTNKNRCEKHVQMYKDMNVITKDFLPIILYSFDEMYVYLNEYIYELKLHEYILNRM